MNIWLAHSKAGSGTDIFKNLLAEGLQEKGHNVHTDAFSRYLASLPWSLKYAAKAPAPTDITVSTPRMGFAVKPKTGKLVVVVHLPIFEQTYKKYRSLSQALFHETVLRYSFKKSFEAADEVVAISDYVAECVRNYFDLSNVTLIPNGVDTDLFAPAQEGTSASKNAKIRVLFVGNLLRRKGVDLLPPIMEKLGPSYELWYTKGLRTTDLLADTPHTKCLGAVPHQEVLHIYQQADVLLFPTRLEGMPYVPLEAMACGTPVVASDCASLPEIITDGEDGRLCPVDNVDAFAEAVREITSSREKLNEMGRKAREKVVTYFDKQRTVDAYASLFRHLTR